jgi:hypothetical protein
MISTFSAARDNSTHFCCSITLGNHTAENPRRHFGDIELVGNWNSHWSDTIARRNWHGDIGVPKTDKSKRLLAIGDPAGRCRKWIAKPPHKDPDALEFPNEGNPTQPHWYSGVRQALKRALKA